MLDVSIKHAFGAFTLDAQFSAPPGVTVLFGRSGSGKTSVVNALAGLLKPDAGYITLGERVLLDTSKGLRLPPYRRRVGYIFQEGRLFPHLTVRQNLGYGAWFAPKDQRRGRDEMGHVVDLLGIGSLLERRPAALSGGEKQRVAIGRALLSSPRLILADEPLAALDEARKAEILPYFERLRDEVSIPILYVSHSVSEVARLATTVVALQDGKVAAFGPASEVLGDVASAQIMGLEDLGSVLTGRVVAHHDDGLSEVATAGGALFLPGISAQIGGYLRVRISAQDVILSRDRPEGLSALNILRGEISAVSPHEHGVVVALQLGQDRVLARITARSAKAMGLMPGQSCHAIVKSVAVAPQDVGWAPTPNLAP